MLGKMVHLDVKQTFTFLITALLPAHLPLPIVHVLSYLTRQGANYPPQKGVALCIYVWGAHTGGDLARRPLSETDRP